MLTFLFAHVLTTPGKLLMPVMPGDAGDVPLMGTVEGLLMPTLPPEPASAPALGPRPGPSGTSPTSRDLTRDEMGAGQEAHTAGPAAQRFVDVHAKELDPAAPHPGPGPKAASAARAVESEVARGQLGLPRPSAAPPLGTSPPSDLRGPSARDQALPSVAEGPGAESAKAQLPAREAPAEGQGSGPRSASPAPGARMASGTRPAGVGAQVSQSGSSLGGSVLVEDEDEDDNF